ncbi:unnamed protein product [Ceutorhynchus assimilis]|uniref:Uncharacterized protein n=1 Tax=Ceutorhynchus assimilis TaxID=467358 RepID=A0A9N9ML26_9CUCU|nr:unnamed protein product [Ceutorhynchus assimilis]
MKLLLLALLSLSTFNYAVAQDEQQDVIDQDYLVQLLFSISEARLPNYLVDVIYNRPVQKGISVDAVLGLYQIRNVSLNTTQSILNELDITQSRVFSINGFNYTLETFNWTFTNFYNTLVSRINLSGLPLRNALRQLNIDDAQFSAGIAYGDPDPWQEFIRGNFTQVNMELACAEAGITLEQLWQGVRDLFILNLETFQIEDFIRLLLNHDITQRHALIIWSAIPVTLEHVYSLHLYNDIIGNFSERLNNQTSLGVITSLQGMVTHRAIHDLFKEERELLIIQAQTLLTRTILTVGNINDTIYRNLVVLELSQDVSPNLTVIPVTNRNADVTNCDYVTFQNNNILTVNVPTANFTNETYVIPTSVINNVVPGSALVCNQTVHALVRGVVGDAIVADAFSNYVVPAPPSSGNSLLAGIHIIVTVLFMMLII